MQAYFLRFLLFFSVPLFAQNNAPLATANRLYRDLGYHEALKFFGTAPPDLATMRKIANAYRLNHDTQNAEKWYAQVVPTTTEPLDFFHFAQALQSNGNAELAKSYFSKYARFSALDQRGAHFANFIDQAAERLRSSSVEVRNLRRANSGASDFCPVFFQHGLVFASTRPKDGSTDAWTGDEYASLYFFPRWDDGAAPAPVPFSTGGLDARYHAGPVAFSRQGDEVFFTRNEQADKTGNRLGLKIFFARKEAQTWGEATKIDLGDPAASDAHPALSPNGRQLFFASNRQGGYGGMDLYVSTFSHGKWGLPVNLGSSVNTAGNEVFPFVHDDGTLYFATDGWGGLGGLDIFACAKMPTGSWGKSHNLGAPFNSSMDDLGFVLAPDALEGFFSSDRPGGMGKDDIYHFSLPEPLAWQVPEPTSTAILVIDQMTGKRLAEASVTPLSQQEGGSLVGYDEEERLLLRPGEPGSSYQISRQLRDPFAPVAGISETCRTDGNGRAELAPQLGLPRFFLVNAAGYQAVVYDFGENTAEPEHRVTLPPLPASASPVGKHALLISPNRNAVRLQNIGELSTEGVIIELEKIYYDLGSAAIRPDAARELNKLADFMQGRPEVLVELRAHTDARGDNDFNRELSAQRAQAAANYIVQQGIDVGRITFLGLGEDQIINHCVDGVDCPETAHQRNRRTEVRIYRR